MKKRKGTKSIFVIERKKIFLLFLCALCIALLTYYAGLLTLEKTGLIGSVRESILIELVNQNRVQESVSQLTENPLLVVAAEQKAKDMAKQGYFSHTSPQGVSSWDWFDAVGYKYEYAGENLAVNFYDSHDVHNAWLASYSHKKNILDSRFTEIGIATAEGTYKGKPAIFVVQMFGAPKK